MRRYFILARPGNNEFVALDACIGFDNSKQRYSIDGSQILIKTTTEIIDNSLNGDVSALGVEYTENEINSLMITPQWTDQTKL